MDVWFNVDRWGEYLVLNASLLVLFIMMIDAMEFPSVHMDLLR